MRIKSTYIMKKMKKKMLFYDGIIITEKLIRLID